MDWWGSDIDRYFSALENVSNNQQHEDLNGKLLAGYNALCNIIEDTRSDFRVKALCNIALAYLSIDKDCVPVEEDIGLVDDIYIILKALEAIKILVPDIYYDVVSKDENLEKQLLDTVHAEFKCLDLLGSNASMAMEFSGLAPFIDRFELWGSSESLKSLLSAKEEFYLILFIKAKDYLLENGSLEKLMDGSIPDDDLLPLMRHLAKIGIGEEGFIFKNQVYPVDDNFSSKGLQNGRVRASRLSLVNNYRRELEKTTGSFPVNALPSLIKTAQEIYSEPETPWEAKLYLSSALAYSMIPDRIVPMKVGSLGLTDDVLVTGFALLNALDYYESNNILEVWDRNFPEIDDRQFLQEIIQTSSKLLIAAYSEEIAYHILSLTSMSIIDDILSWMFYQEGFQGNPYTAWLKVENSRLLRSIKIIEGKLGRYDRYRNLGELRNRMTESEKATFESLRSRMTQGHLNGSINPHVEMDRLRRLISLENNGV